ncbi:MAG: DivIVA domain-containing protein [Cytophagales bacterium]|nr:DivIVA domain-containing protein [Cytophagales bacterium]
MKITPLEIRQKDFEKKLRGYDKDEVQAFLVSLSNEWERMVGEGKELQIKLEHAEKEVKKLREVESSLFKTLKTAEDTGANLVDQANKAADLHLKETQMNAEALLSESKQKARAIIEKAEQEAKEIINEVQEGVKELDLNYKTIENHRDNLIKDLMNLADDIVERIQRTDKQKSDFVLQDQVQRVRNLARESEKKIDKEHLEVKAEPIEHISVEKIQEEVAEKKSRELKKDNTEVKEKIPAGKSGQSLSEALQKAEKELAVNDTKETEVAKEKPKAPKEKPQASFFDSLEED